MVRVFAQIEKEKDRQKAGLRFNLLLSFLHIAPLSSVRQFV